jgi:hypothetical protein
MQEITKPGPERFDQDQDQDPSFHLNTPNKLDTNVHRSMQTDVGKSSRRRATRLVVHRAVLLGRRQDE